MWFRYTSSAVIRALSPNSSEPPAPIGTGERVIQMRLCTWRPAASGCQGLFWRGKTHGRRFSGFQFHIFSKYFPFSQQRLILEKTFMVWSCLCYQPCCKALSSPSWRPAWPSLPRWGAEAGVGLSRGSCHHTWTSPWVPARPTAAPPACPWMSQAAAWPAGGLFPALCTPGQHPALPSPEGPCHTNPSLAPVISLCLAWPGQPAAVPWSCCCSVNRQGADCTSSTPPSFWSLIVMTNCRRKSFSVIKDSVLLYSADWLNGQMLAHVFSGQ